MTLTKHQYLPIQPKQLAKLSLSLIKHPIYTFQALYTLSFTNNCQSSPIEECIRRGADWLLLAQQNSADGSGYSRRFSLINGWDQGYIETTGYIIPTLINVSTFLGEEKYRESALLAAEWLLEVQTIEGAFTDIDSHRPQVFDTGQVMLGLNQIFRKTGDQRYLESAYKAGHWLLNNQESDGSWRRFAYKERPHAYYSRVASALIETGQLTAIERFIEAGQRNLEWVASQEQANSYFRHCEFREGEDAILHAIVYVLEGFLMAFQLTGENRWAEIAIRGANALRILVNKIGLLYSQYNENWDATNKEFCVTGLAQYAGICFDIFRITRDEEFFKLGEVIMGHLSRWQTKRGKNIDGALPSSIPIWGYYGGMDFYNWNVKFFLDAALKLEATS